MIEELRAKAEALGIKVDGRWKESKLLQVIADASDTAPDSTVVEVRADPGPEPVDNSRIEFANAYAVRIWEGQSPDLPIHERTRRIKSALEGLGYADTLDKLSLPNG